MKMISHFLTVRFLSFAAACGIRNVEFATEGKREVTCKRCRKTKQFKKRSR
jgi:hypothetical protein